MVAIDGEQQRRDGAEQARAEQSPRCPTDHDDRDRPQQGDREPPPERAVDAEQPLAKADEPLANRGMHDQVAGRRVEDVRGPLGEGLVDLVAELLGVTHLDAVQDHRPALLDVVRLVEDELVGVAQVPEPQDATDDGRSEGPEPSQQALPRWVGEQATAQVR